MIVWDENKTYWAADSPEHFTVARITGHPLIADIIAIDSSLCVARLAFDLEDEVYRIEESAWCGLAQRLGWRDQDHAVVYALGELPSTMFVSSPRLVSDRA